MSSAELHTTLKEAEAFIQDETPARPSHSRTAYDTPGENSYNFGRSNSVIRDDNDVQSLRKKFNFLKDFSDNFVRTTPLEVLLKTETTSIKLKEYERNKSASARLSHNRDELASTFIQVKGGRDNRWDVLHEARFLPGACVPATQLWLRARDVLGTAGHTPISTYDMNSIGLGGFVSKRGWVELHEVGSDNLSLKLFNINNCGNRVGGSRSGDQSDEFRDIQELGEFKLSLRVAREALSYVHPWNKSISAIEGFLHQTDFCKKDLEGVEKQGVVLTQYVDYCFGENADTWRGRLPFLTTGDLKASLEAFWGARPDSKAKPKQNNNNSKWREYRQSLKGGFDPNYFDDVCRMFNFGKCVKAPGTCTTRGGIPLRHVCNFKTNPNNPKEVCGKPHPAIFNH
jgi:hypothetical protein